MKRYGWEKGHVLIQRELKLISGRGRGYVRMDSVELARRGLF